MLYIAVYCRESYSHGRYDLRPRAVIERIYIYMQSDSHAPLLIVGLGNPGTEYAHTRHNIGFLVVDQLAARHKATWRSERALRAHTADVTIGGRSVLLAKPITYVLPVFFIAVQTSHSIYNLLIARNKNIHVYLKIV